MKHRNESPGKRAKPDEVLHRLERIEYWQGRLMVALFLIGAKIMAKLDALEAEVAEVEGAVDSAIALITGLRAEIIEAGTDPEKLADLVRRLDEKQQALAAAVAANPTPPE
jgi:hypothetical protein